MQFLGGKQIPQLGFYRTKIALTVLAGKRRGQMTSIRKTEQTYRTWSSPILLELKEREHQLDAEARQALQNVLVERRLVDTGNPSGEDRRGANPGTSGRGQ